MLPYLPVYFTQSLYSLTLYVLYLEWYSCVELLLIYVGLWCQMLLYNKLCPSFCVCGAFSKGKVPKMQDKSLWLFLAFLEISASDSLWPANTYNEYIMQIHFRVGADRSMWFPLNDQIFLGWGWGIKCFGVLNMNKG